MIKCQYNRTVIFLFYSWRCKLVACYKRIRELREDNDMTQQQVADYLSMKQPQYNRYERGFRDIPTDVLIALAELYKTSTDYILGRVENK